MKQSVPMQEVLRQLSHGDAVSGQALARRMGITRAAIWKQIAALRALGLPIAARTGTGYHLPWPVDLLDARHIMEALGASAAPVHVYWQLDSTQAELARMAPQAPDLTAVLAENQVTGRGRRGRPWQCPPGLGLTLSCLKHFDSGPAALSGLSIAMGVCAVQALASVDAASGLQIKWPNDLVTPQGKLAGILIEVSGEYEGPCTARVGLGLNLRLTPEWRAQLQQPATDLAALCHGELPARNLLAARLIEHLRNGLLRFEDEGLAAFGAEFARLDGLAGQALTVHAGDGEYHGMGCGIDEHGALRVRVNDQVIRVVSDKVSVRRKSRPTMPSPKEPDR